LAKLPSDLTKSKNEQLERRPVGGNVELNYTLDREEETFVGLHLFASQ
jgi:hypothetical protein